jgi:hypothetical protein
MNSLSRGCYYQREHKSLAQGNTLVAAGDSNVCIGPIETKQAQEDHQTNLADRLTVQVWILSVVVAIVAGSLLTWLILSISG